MNKILCNNSGQTESLWMEVKIPSFKALKKDAKADVCVVGAGIAGLTSAYTLAKLGKSVIVLDRGPAGGGQTARTTAHVSWALDDRYYDLEKFFGKKGARLAAESHSAAIDYMEKIVLEEEIDCDWERVDGYLFVPQREPKKILEKEFLAVLRAGKEIHKVERAPLSSAVDTGLSLQFPKQAQFHPLKYIHGLIKAILKYGGKIYTGVHVSKFEEGAVETESGHKVVAHSIIAATCTPINDRFFIHTKQAAYRTYVIAGAIPKNTVSKGLYWDTGDPYHYIRTQRHLTDPELDWLIVGGEDHKTGQDGHTQAKYKKLEKWARKYVPELGEIGYRWSGQVFEPIDSLAFIGRNPREKNTYIVTGDSGNGITHGTIAGLLIPDLILGNKNPWESLYDPSRKTISALPEYISETFNVAWQYRDLLTPGERKKIDNLKPEKGIILRKGLKKIAVFKDKHNKIHINSALCPHLYGCVRWNPEEKSWDCPCHGSRFDGCGKVLNGPAIDDLNKHI